MTDLDALARSHAERVRTATSRIAPPGLDLDTRVVSDWGPIRAVIVALAAALFVAALLFSVERPVEVQPVATVPATTLNPLTTVPDTTLIPAGEGAFVPVPSMTGWCAWCMAVVLEDGRALVLGGRDTDTGSVIAEIYDPATSTFSVAGHLIYDYPGDATSLPDGRVLIVGVPNTDEGSARAEIFDPATGQSYAIDREDPVGAEAVSLADGRVLVIGEAAIGDGVAPAVVFDPSTEAFTEIAPLLNERHTGVTATLLANGRVLVVGGEPTGSAEIYDPETETFSPTGSLNVPRDAFTATPLSDGTVLIAGGTDEGGETFDSAEIFNPVSGTFGTTGSMTTARFWHTAASLPDGRVLLIGGGDGQLGQEQATAEIYNPRTREFNPAPPPIGPRLASTAVALADGVLVFGHYPGNDPTASLEDGYTAEVFTLSPSESSEG
jgi:hypothetical protein